MSQSGLGGGRAIWFIIDPVIWGALVVLLLRLEISVSWMLLIVPLWITVRIVRFVKRGKDEGIW
jgi:hypothetical protein